MGCVHQRLARQAVEACSGHDGGEQALGHGGAADDAVGDLDGLLINDARTRGGGRAPAGGRHRVVVADALRLLCGGLGMGMGVPLQEAGEDVVIEGIVEAGAERIVLVGQLLGDVARVEPRLGVGRVVGARDVGGMAAAGGPEQ